MAARRTLDESLNPKRNSLNAIRLILAILVIISHTWPLGGYGDDPGIGDQDLGDWSVAGFFAISGYLITMSRTRSRTFIDYLWRRIMRIYPAFMVCLVVIAFGFAPLSVLLFHEGTYSLVHGVHYTGMNLGLFIAQAGITGTLENAPVAGSWNGSLWTLFYEFLCYIGIGILVSILPKKFLATAITIAFISFTIVTCAHLFAEIAFPDKIVRMARLGAFFLAGSIVFIHRKRLPMNNLLLAAAIGTIATTMFTHTFQAFAGLPVAYLLLALGSNLSLERLGATNDLSYGMYIYAFPVQQMLFLTFPKGDLPPLLFAALSIGATVPLAWASWLLVEKPTKGLRRPIIRKVKVSS